MSNIDLSTVDVEDMLDALEMRNIIDDGDEMRFSCPFPEHRNGDENPSAYMNKESTAWTCFGCKRKGNAVTFLADLENISRFEARRFLRERYDSDFRPPEGGSMVAEWDAHFTPKEREEMEIVVLPESMLTEFDVDWYHARSFLRDDPIAGYWFSRGFTPETLHEWDFGFDARSNRLTIPVRDAGGELVGFKARTTEKDRHPKYLVLGDRPDKDKGYGFVPYKSGNYVFGMDKVGQAERAIIVEGELDAVTLWQMGLPAVALGGSQPTPRQMLVLRWHVDEVIIFLDDDPAGIDAANKLIDELEPFMRVRVVPSHDGDPNSMEENDVRDLLDQAVTSLLIR